MWGIDIHYGVTLQGYNCTPSLPLAAGGLSSARICGDYCGIFTVEDEANNAGPWGRTF